MQRFRKLARAGVDAAKLLRTRGKVAMTYGQAITGVADGTMRDQRRVAGAASAPAAGACGQNLDAALMIADGGVKGRADPAFDAHDLPIGQWAEAVWLQWLPMPSLLVLVASAKARLVGAKRVGESVRAGSRNGGNLCQDRVDGGRCSKLHHG